MNELPYAAIVAMGAFAWILASGSRKRRQRPGTLKQTRARHSQWQKEAQQTLRSIRQQRTTAEETIQRLRTMNPYAFEYLITNHFQDRGFDTRKITRASGDGGIDGMIHINGRWHLVQAKRYTNSVSRSAVSQFAEVCQAKRMPGMFITTSRFSGATVQHCRRHQPKLILIDGNGLIGLLSRT